jgi:hypothetical protein
VLSSNRAIATIEGGGEVWLLQVDGDAIRVVSSTSVCPTTPVLIPTPSGPFLVLSDNGLGKEYLKIPDFQVGTMVLFGDAMVVSDVPPSSAIAAFFSNLNCGWLLFILTLKDEGGVNQSVDPKAKKHKEGGWVVNLGKGRNKRKRKTMPEDDDDLSDVES